MIENEHNYKGQIIKLEKAKIEFHSLLKFSEESKLHYEIAKLNPDLSSSQKNKFNLKLNDSLIESKKAENIYIEILNESNNLREKYIIETKAILNEFQEMEIGCIEFIKSIFLVYYEEQKNLNEKLNEDFQNKRESVVNISSELDIKDFISSNSTNSLPPFKFDYIPFNSELNLKPSEFQGSSIEIINGVRNFLNQSFKIEIHENEIDAQEQKNMNYIDDILNCAWEGKINDDDKKNVLNILKKVYKIDTRKKI